MPNSITVDNLDAALMKCLQAEAKKRGLDLGTMVKELLNDSFDPSPKAANISRHGDLDELAGTWSDDEADAFLATIADFGRVDEELWK